ncbi:MAG: hypothetical protein ONB05_04830 [candidate division KSB1 bacterium]|nr:hypothetical protein [candidate division KSB1 bacterium]
MEWIESLQGQIVGLDTTPLLYFIEENPIYLKMVRPFFEADEIVLMQMRLNTLKQNLQELLTEMPKVEKTDYIITESERWDKIVPQLQQGLSEITAAKIEADLYQKRRYDRCL